MSFCRYPKPDETIVYESKLGTAILKAKLTRAVVNVWKTLVVSDRTVKSFAQANQGAQFTTPMGNANATDRVQTALDIEDAKDRRKGVLDDTEHLKLLDAYKADKENKDGVLPDDNKLKTF